MTRVQRNVYFERVSFYNSELFPDEAILLSSATSHVWKQPGTACSTYLSIHFKKLQL